MTEEQTPYVEQCDSTVSRALQYMPELEERVQQMVADFDKYTEDFQKLCAQQYEQFGVLSLEERRKLNMFGRYLPNGDLPELISYLAAFILHGGDSKRLEENPKKSMNCLVQDFRRLSSTWIYRGNTRDDIHDDVLDVLTKELDDTEIQECTVHGVVAMLSNWIVSRLLGDGTLGMLNALWQEQHQSIADDARQEVLMLYIADSIPAVCELWQQPLSTAVPGRWAMPVHRANVTAALYDLDRFHRINEIVQQV